MVGDAIYAMLTANPAVRALVAQRVYADAAPENVIFPYLTFEQPSEEVMAHLTGRSDARRGTVTVWAWATTRLACRQLADAITAALDSASGFWSGTCIEGIFLSSAADRYEQPEDATQRGVFGVELSFRANYRS